jgi:NADPH-dependent 2,4-dienoyl-CoA reductase/sulfur reductase-like enzyme
MIERFSPKTILMEIFGEDRLPIARHSLGAMGVNFEGEAHVESIDVENKRLELANGGTRSYTKLLLATGAAPRKLDLPGTDLPHVVTLRSLADCRRILDALKDIRQFGGPEVLKLEKVGTPKPSAGEALVRIHAAGVNPYDTSCALARMP